MTEIRQSLTLVEGNLFHMKNGGHKISTKEIRQHKLGINLSNTYNKLVK